jgi:hypothetical protein
MTRKAFKSKIHTGKKLKRQQSVYTNVQVRIINNTETLLAHYQRNISENNFEVYIQLYTS